MNSTPVPSCPPPHHHHYHPSPVLVFISQSLLTFWASSWIQFIQSELNLRFRWIWKACCLNSTWPGLALNWTWIEIFYIQTWRMEHNITLNKNKGIQNRTWWNERLRLSVFVACQVGEFNDDLIILKKIIRLSFYTYLKSCYFYF